MRNAPIRLEEWRCAERRRDSLPPDSAEWLAADEDVRAARAAFKAEAAQAGAYYAEVEYEAAHDRGWASRSRGLPRRSREPYRQAEVWLRR